MSLTVREALSLQVLKDATLVAGHRGLDNPIRWTHIIDHADVADWVKGGEVLITTGFGIQDNPQAQIRYMTEAVEKKVAAVFIAKQVYLPHTTPEMRAIADEHGLPLVELLPTTAFVEVTEAILRRLATRSLDAEREYLIDALLAGNLPESVESVARLTELGVDPERPHALTLAQISGRAADQQLTEEESRLLIGALSHAPRRAALIVRPSWLVAIFPLAPREESSTPFAHSLDRLLGERGMSQIRIGVGRLARRLADFPKSYREAREALFIASLSGDSRQVWHFNDLGVWRLLLRVEDQTEIERLAHYYLSPLTDHDRDQQTSWLRTLETFLEQNGNLRATARELELHRNTITYQIEHIGKILGQDLNNPEVRLNLQLALRARMLLNARGSKAL